MEPNAFTSLTSVNLPSPSRLLSSACCPDKDLLLLITRVAGRDRMSLWKVNGSKTWEVDVSSSSETIVGFDWSPDGQSIAIAHDPPAITIHSIQDGREERALKINENNTNKSSITGVWWRSQEKTVQTPTPDIFRRNNILTGSAHSILRNLPLLDGLQDDSQQISATDLFAFQGSQTHASRASSVPDVIQSWPTLEADLLAASISPSTSARTADDGVVDEIDDTNLNSLLVTAQTDGHLHFFLDGAYPMGSVALGENALITTLFKDQTRPILYLHLDTPVGDSTVTDLRPTVVKLPLLEQRKIRDFAKLSTTAKELAWYIMRVANDMRSTWLGSETSTGACELSPKWLRTLAEKQRSQFGLENPQPVLDLTALLVTGRASESLADFLGSGEQMSERGIQKWESIVTEALVKLRDYSEKRFSPACQRLYIVLEEVSGWSNLPILFPSFQIPNESVGECLLILKRGIMLSSWLATAARRELNRFKEFITWIRYEIAVAATPSNETPPLIQHDILEVNQYIVSGLESSSIDMWFSGASPSFTLEDLGIPPQELDLSSALRQAQEKLAHPDQLAWHINIDPSEVAIVDRNLHALVEDMISKCRLVFDRAAGATTRAASISYGGGSSIGKHHISRSRLLNGSSHRERVVSNQNKDGFMQYVAVHAPSVSEDRACFCLLRHWYEDESPTFQVEAALLDCCIMEDGSPIRLDILAYEFFDDQAIIIVYRYRQTDGETFIGMVHYDDLGYQDLQWRDHVTLLVREELTELALDRLEAGELTCMAIPIRRCRSLDSFRTGDLHLAVNGRVGRRISCILNDKGTILEGYDMEDDEAAEGEDEMETDADGI